MDDATCDEVVWELQRVFGRVVGRLTIAFAHERPERLRMRQQFLTHSRGHVTTPRPLFPFVTRFKPYQGFSSMGDVHWRCQLLGCLVASADDVDNAGAAPLPVVHSAAPPTPLLCRTATYRHHGCAYRKLLAPEVQYRSARREALRHENGFARPPRCAPHVGSHQSLLWRRLRCRLC